MIPASACNVYNNQCIPMVTSDYLLCIIIDHSGLAGVHITWLTAIRPKMLDCSDNHYTYHELIHWIVSLLDLHKQSYGQIIGGQLEMSCRDESRVPWDPRVDSSTSWVSSAPLSVPNWSSPLDLDICMVVEGDLKATLAEDNWVLLTAWPVSPFLDIRYYKSLLIILSR